MNKIVLWIIVFLVGVLFVFLTAWLKRESSYKGHHPAPILDLLFLSLLLLSLWVYLTWWSKHSSSTLGKGFTVPGEEKPIPISAFATKAPSSPPSGLSLFKKRGCAGCHTLDGSPGLGPTLKGLLGRTETLEDGTTVVVDEAYLRESLLKPRARIVRGYEPLMPSYEGIMTAQELETLVKWLKQQ